MIPREIKHNLMAHFTAMYNAAGFVFEEIQVNPFLAYKMKMEKGWDVPKALQQIRLEGLEAELAHSILEKAKIIVFDHEQADVFMEQVGHYSDGLDFHLPFADTMIYFSQPVSTMTNSEPDTLVGILMRETVQTEESYEFTKRYTEILNKQLAIGEGFQVPPKSVGQTIYMLVAIYGDLNIRKLTWTSETKGTPFFEEGETEIQAEWNRIKNLALSCIGYINCSNVELHENEAPHKVNRKRERNGKTALEPYYTCRIKGLTYNENGDVVTVASDGRSVSFRFDVRGFFRRLASGKVTWVRPHQRGLANSLYLPKTYIVQGAA